jgi:hypothetical protein
MDEITIQIKCSSETCEKLREQGLFFDTIAETLDIDRNDIIEVCSGTTCLDTLSPSIR